MAERNAPVYYYSWDYAVMYKEEEAYAASVVRNKECRDFAEITIENNCLWNFSGPVTCSFNAETAAKAVIKQFGLERTAHVVINTIVAKVFDHRICPENREWAKSWPVLRDKVEKGPWYDGSYVINGPHSCMFDAFATAVRLIYTNK